mmetsp:Transcript_101512/g.302822  ORF Transcript_101512/g.302822 Transcript_101512/m.302822 type:complete len:322 (-) Transcript_101512:118-1083(-)|eukprot:CAMPEP_0175242536 /NCGR_PEP_ID=MMETSP0093-20121207/31118_1 /TAXON_ID=311494 /ORGANISM="Alexandrium monilatum, Strain CCMP3105" /LENGTH=321 /DNA_ID=CAMNT_0016536613 /DNA_START=93 /DNA_END=1061 /DNA_ORIENTATION=-
MAEGCGIDVGAGAGDSAEAADEGESACSHDPEIREDGARERRIRRADHSLGDVSIIADLEAVTAEDLNDVPHVLKSFYTWMDVGPSKKSAKSYTMALKRLMVSHRKTLSAMRADRYFEFVKTSVENLQCNSLISASLKKLISWMSERSNGSAGPWEHRAAQFETLFSITRGFTCWGGAALPVATKEAAISCFFPKADKGDAMCSTPPPASREAAFETPLKRNYAVLERGGSSGSGFDASGHVEKAPRLADTSAEAGAPPAGTASPGIVLTADQRARIEANRAAALARRAAQQLWSTIEADQQAGLARHASTQAAAARAMET